MIQNLLTLFNRACLIMSLVFIYSCDDGTVSEGPREKDFLTRVSAERTVVNDEIVFTDLSLGAVTRSWVFEGGDPSSSSSPEVYVSFTEAGIKNCSLVVNFSDGSQETQNFSIEVLPELVANFTYATTGANIPIQFTDTSQGEPDGWLWTFPGGTPATSTEQNPSVTWPSEREVTVTLTVTRSFDDVTTSYILPISIGPPNLWTLAAQSFEDPNSPSWWQTWLGGGGWPAGSLTIASGGANGTANTARVTYPGGATWNMITRDTRAHNAVIYKGKTYKISFYVKAQTATTIAFVRFANQIPSWWPDVWKNGDPNQGFYSQGIYGISVTTDWQYHEAQFTVNDLPYDVGLNTFPDIELNGPVAPNVIFIDEIRLQQLD